MIASGVRAAWREVKPIVLGLAGTSLLAGLARRRGLALASAGLLGGVFYFFRDPERFPPSTGREWILSPADGVVTHIDHVHEPHFFNGPVQRVSIFLSLLDVHVQRAPYAGTVKFLRYESGEFAPAFLKDTHTNESNFVGLDTPHGPLGVKQIVGILARRIVCWPAVDDTLATGQRLGLIKFGSRVDLFLPANTELLVHTGQKVYGGQTIVARWLA
ncbi:MAG: phosphatidylserine decarboxylase [Chloroflexi bacterium]|nr:MAG: phosphatidylserine decarboxylase [Chloroflexota bacterium]